MKTFFLLLASCLLLAPLSISANAQEDSQYENEAEFSLHHYSPSHVQAESLFLTLESMYGRILNFQDRQIKNITLLDQSVVIYEKDDRMKRIILAMNQLDTSGDESEDNSGEESDANSRYTAAQVSLLSYLPENFSVRELYDLASDLYGRDIVVGGQWHSNLRYTSQSILVYEELSAGKALVAKLAELDASQAPQANVDYVAFEYMPRFVSANGLMEGIRPFVMGVTHFDRSKRPAAMTTNISLMSERGVLLIRDTESRVKEIVETLKRLDQPAPQMMLVCQVLRGVNHDTDNPAAAVLQKQLRTLLPYENYAVEVNGMLRGSAKAGTRMELKMGTGDQVDTEYRLQIRIGAYDPNSGALGLEACELSSSDTEHGGRELFRTSTTIYAGEYAVIGVTGTEPLFLVVQLHPVNAPR